VSFTTHTVMLHNACYAALTRVPSAIKLNTGAIDITRFLTYEKFNSLHNLISGAKTIHWDEIGQLVLIRY